MESPNPRSPPSSEEVPLGQEAAAPTIGGEHEIVAGAANTAEDDTPDVESASSYANTVTKADAETDDYSVQPLLTDTDSNEEKGAVNRDGLPERNKQWSRKKKLVSGVLVSIFIFLALLIPLLNSSSKNTGEEEEQKPKSWKIIGEFKGPNHIIEDIGNENESKKGIGNFVSLSENGDIVAIGKINQDFYHYGDYGEVLVFGHVEDSLWRQRGSIIAGLEEDSGVKMVSLSPNGSIVMLEERTSGNFLVYDYQSTDEWTQRGGDRSCPHSDCYWDQSISKLCRNAVDESSMSPELSFFSSDGNRVAIGGKITYNDTSTSLYVEVNEYVGGGSWELVGDKIPLLEKYVIPAYDFSLSLSHDGSVLAVSTHFDIDCDGDINWSRRFFVAVYRFESNGWTQIGKNVVEEEITENERQEYKVLLSPNGNFLVIGHFDSNEYLSNNTAHIFEYSTDHGDWMQRGDTITLLSYEAGIPILLSSDGQVAAVGFGQYNMGPPFEVLKYDIDQDCWVSFGPIIDEDIYRVRDTSLSYDGSVLAVGMTHFMNGTYSSLVRIFQYDEWGP